jgi:uncharacterized protein YxeA
MKKTTIIILIVLAGILIAGYYLVDSKNPQPEIPYVRPNPDVQDRRQFEPTPCYNSDGVEVECKG